MKRTTTPSVFVLMMLFFISSSKAQITIVSTDMPSSVTPATYRSSIGQAFPGMDETLAGSNYTWDYSQLTPTSQNVDTFVAVPFLYFSFLANSTYGLKSNTPTVNLGLVTIDYQYDFYKKATSSYVQTGSGINMSGFPLPVQYSPKDTIYRFPLHYGNIGSSTSTFAVSIPTLGFYGGTKTRIDTVDGWGTLITPYGTFNALRVKSVIYESDTIHVDTLFHFGLRLPTTIVTQYKWLGTGQGIPLLQINTSGGNVTQIIYRDSLRNLTPVACTGAPSPGTITLSDTLICGGTGSAILTLPSNPLILGISYHWKSGHSASGPWSSFGANNSVVSSGIITDTTFFYCVLTCDSSGLSDSTSIVQIAVSQSPSPLVSTYVSNNGNYCAGIPDTLIASGALTYSWTPSTGLSATTGDTVFASVPGNPGATIQYTVTGFDSIGCKTRINVNLTRHSTTIPVIHASPNDTVCAGQQLILNAVPSAGSTATLAQYLWSTGETNDSIILMPTTDSVFIVNVVNQFGCPSADTIQIRVVAGSPPVITSLTRSNNGIYCIGQNSVTLVVAGAGGTDFTWSPATGLSNTFGDTVHATPNATILYTVKLTNSSGCAAIDTIRVRGTNPPNLQGFQATPNDSICMNDTLSLRILVSNGTLPCSFVWTPGTAGDTLQTNRFAPPVNSRYYVEVTRLSNGCKSRDSINIVVQNCITGLNDLNRSEEIFLSPNPTNGIVTVQFTHQPSEAVLQVLNSIGQVVSERLIPKGNQLYKGEIDLSGLPSGIYLIHLNTSFINITRKLIKM